MKACASSMSSRIDDEREAGRREVLLRAGIDERELRDVDRSAEHVRRRVGDERHGTDGRHVLELGAEDRVVRRVVHVGGIRIERQLLLPRDAREVLGLGRRRNLDAADALRFLDRFLRPRAGDDVVGRSPARAAGSSAPSRTGGWRRPAETARDSRPECRRGCAESASQPSMMSSNGFERWLISRIDMPTPGSESRSRCACSSTSTGSTAGPAEKLKMRVVVVMSREPLRIG